LKNENLPMFQCDINKQSVIYSYTEHIRYKLNKDNISFNLLMDIMNIKDSQNCKEIKDKQILELISSNKGLLLNKYFINFYYWITDLKLDYLLQFDCNNFSNVKVLLNYINPIVKENLVVIRKCCTCNSSINISKELQINRTSKKLAINVNKTWQCDECVGKQKKIEEKQLFMKTKELNQIQQKIKKFDNLVSNIIITKYGDNFYIDIENKEIVNNLSDNFIRTINSIFEIDKTDDTIRSTDKGNQAYKFMKGMDISVINPSLLTIIYRYFTSLRLDNLDKIYNREFNNEIIIKIIDDKTKRVSFEYPTARNSPMKFYYQEFQNWLFKKYKNGLDFKLDFKTIFIDNNFSKDNIIDDESKEASVEQIKEWRKLDYSDYLKTEHWQEVRQRALKIGKHKCALCSSTEKLNVHHNTYENFGNEQIEDLTVLCHNCHSKYHNKENYTENNIDINRKNIIPTEYLMNISRNALNDKMEELNKLFGYDIIKEIHIDFNEFF